MSQRSRSLPVSKELLAALRLCEGVASSDLLPDEEIAVSESAGRLGAEGVAYVERELGHALPDELLSLLAIGHPVAAIVTGIRDLSSILDAAENEIDTSELDDDRTWLPVSMVYNEPLSEIVDGAHGGPYLTLCVPPGSREVPLPVLVLGGESPLIAPLGKVISDIIRDELSRLEPDVPIRPLASYTPPEPCIVEDRPARAAAPARRVRHKKFGEGVVIDSEGDGPDARLTVDFVGIGRKKLVARFVEDA